jgi:hypothetical protein
LTLIFVNFNGCFYSFTGASVPAHLKTIAIPFADDRSGSAEPNLSQKFTDALIQKFVQDNTLQIAERSKADAILEVSILPFTDAPAVISAGDNQAVTQRKLTLSARVVYRDMVEKKVIFDRNFSNFANYDAGSITGRTEAVESALDLITEDILLGVIANW